MPQFQVPLRKKNCLAEAAPGHTRSSLCKLQRMVLWGLAASKKKRESMPHSHVLFCRPSLTTFQRLQRLGESTLHSPLWPLQPQKTEQKQGMQPCQTKMTWCFTSDTSQVHHHDCRMCKLSLERKMETQTLRPPKHLIFNEC